MEAVKRIEIITLSVRVPQLCEELEKAGTPGYTVFRDVEGFGQRGHRSGDELTGVSSNSSVLVACPAKDVDQLVEAIRPILHEFGGLCLVSDALSVKH